MKLFNCSHSPLEYFFPAPNWVYRILEILILLSIIFFLFTFKAEAATYGGNSNASHNASTSLPTMQIWLGYPSSTQSSGNSYVGLVFNATSGYSEGVGPMVHSLDANCTYGATWDAWGLDNTVTSTFENGLYYVAYKLLGDGAVRNTLWDGWKSNRCYRIAYASIANDYQRHFLGSEIYPDFEYNYSAAYIMADTIADAYGWADTSTAPQTSILYPFNGTSTPLFRNWVVGITNIASSSVGQIGIEYGFASGNYIGSWAVPVFNWPDGYGFVDEGTKFFLPRHDRLPDNETIYARPFWLDSVTMEFTYGPEINFTYNPVTPPVNNSTTAIAGLITPVVREITGLIPTEECNVTNWTGCIYNAIAYLLNNIFLPHDLTLRFLEDSVSQFKTIFPFSVFFQMSELAYSATERTPEEKSITVTIWETEVEVLSSSTVSKVLGTEMKNTIFNLISDIQWAGVGLLIYLIIF